MLADINNALSYAGQLAGGRVEYDTVVQDPLAVCQHRLGASILLLSVQQEKRYNDNFLK